MTFKFAKITERRKTRLLFYPNFCCALMFRELKRLKITLWGDETRLVSFLNFQCLWFIGYSRRCLRFLKFETQNAKYTIGHNYNVFSTIYFLPMFNSTNKMLLICKQNIMRAQFVSLQKKIAPLMFFLHINSIMFLKINIRRTYIVQNTLNLWQVG